MRQKPVLVSLILIYFIFITIITAMYMNSQTGKKENLKLLYMTEI